MSKSITETLKKINISISLNDIYATVFTFIILILFLGFKIVNNPKLIEAKAINYQESKIILEESKTEKHFIYASRKGKKYYYYNCKANIKEANKIYFDTDEAAQKAGYSLSKTCK